MVLCCSALTISDCEAAQRWGCYAPSAGRVGLSIGTLLSISIGLVLGSVAKNIDGNPKNICRRFNRESHPCRKTRAPERDGKATIDCIVPSKECFDLAADFDPSLDERNYLPLSVGVMLDISGSGAEACVSSQHLDIP